MSGEGEVLYFTTAAPAAHTGGQFVDNQGHGFPVALLDASGAPLFTAAAVEADGIANPTLVKVGTYPHLYNGATWDRQYNNSSGTLLASATRTVQTDSATMTNYNASGLILFLNVTAASGSGGLSLVIMGVDPASGASKQINNNGLGPCITTGIVYMSMFAGNASAGTATTGRTNDKPPRTWFLRVAVGDASSYTYSVGYSYLT